MCRALFGLFAGRTSISAEAWVALVVSEDQYTDLPVSLFEEDVIRKSSQWGSANPLRNEVEMLRFGLDPHDRPLDLGEESIPKLTTTFLVIVSEGGGQIFLEEPVNDNLHGPSDQDSTSLPPRSGRNPDSRGGPQIAFSPPRCHRRHRPEEPATKRVDHPRALRVGPQGVSMHSPGSLRCS